MKQLYAPNGRIIVGTLESVPGCASVNGWTVGTDGKPVPDYAGGSNMYWDDSKTIERNGSLVVIDEDGDEHLASECRLVDE